MARRKLWLTGLSAILVGLVTISALGWALLHCERDDYLDRMAPSWLNEREKYLFACGSVWHSFDGGTTWTQVRDRGLPLLARDGYIAADRTPGRMYLGLTLAGRSRLDCLWCAWTKAIPVLYVSEDGGQHWRLAHEFTAGPATDSYFRAVYADPDYAGSAWAILVRGDEVSYYATNTQGRVWRKTCTETYSGQCDPPDDFLANFNMLDAVIERGGGDKSP